MLHEGVSFTLMLHEGLGLWGWWCTRDIAQGVGSVSRSCCTTALHVGWGLWVGGAQRCCTRVRLVSRLSCKRDWHCGVGGARGRCTRDGVAFTPMLHEGVAQGVGVVGWWCTRASHEGCGDFQAVLHEELASGTRSGCCTRALHEDGAGVSREHGVFHGGVARGC